MSRRGGGVMVLEKSSLILVGIAKRDQNAFMTKREYDRAYREANRETLSAKAKERYQANRNVHLARMNEWVKRNPERSAQLKRNWADANREKVRASGRISARKRSDKASIYRKRWIEKNREKVRQWTRLRRARKQKAEGIHTLEDIAAIRVAQRDRCAYCRCRLKGGGDLDHIIPLSASGTNWPSNLQLTCEPCNSSKHARDPVDYARSIGRLI